VERRVWILGAVVCAITLPAMAATEVPLFGFSVYNIRSTFDGVGSFATMDWVNTGGDVYRGSDVANFYAGSWNVGGTLEDFQIQMTITGATSSGATGVGSFTLKDIQGDTISGNLSGAWVNAGGSGVFNGTLSDVTYVSVVNNVFEGHSGDVSMVFPAHMPWDGTLIELTASGGWFTTGAGALKTFDVLGGSLDATVSGMVHAPAPGALALALFGMVNALGLRGRRA
jgi:hypothetical protein